ncbi:hypothetical protein F8388_009098 [Cannabis sativa]|uniref:BSD domain-containing protein n=1 Tax=Cannabis sativa TaxID=3483 RepID=A0A7J6DNZ8_CANSA|nr:hypothetical protein G4B88_026072 [Cannabis sativa]KAF4383067.1 hypothetical protein F8388_009098 [Cannabis sativa]
MGLMVQKCHGLTAQISDEDFRAEKASKAMDISSWFRRSLTRNNNSKSTKNSDLSDQPKQPHKFDDQILGVTDKLIDFVKSFTLDTFKNFPRSDDEEEKNGGDFPTTSGSEISQLRYKLCPGYMKEHQFWGIYFALVKTHVAEYELHAKRLAKRREIALENGKPTDRSACEVEMSETNSANLPPSTP